MKKLRRRVTIGAMAAATAFSLTACNRNQNATVYGPPEEPSEIRDDSWSGETNQNETVYGPPQEEEWFDPASNENEDVYGPPPGEEFEPVFNENDGVSDEPDVFNPQKEYDPEDNENDSLYGVPSGRDEFVNW